jgi:hypothetical protein
VIVNPHNILYWINKSDLTASRPGIGLSDGQYKNWEAAFQSWIQSHGLGNVPPTPDRPVDVDDVHGPQYQPLVSVSSPAENASVTLDQSVDINATAQGLRPIQKYEYYINDQFIGSTEGPVANYSFTPSDYVSVTGVVNVRVVAVDLIYNRGEKSVSIRIQ